VDIQKAASTSAYTLAEIRRQRELTAIREISPAGSGTAAEVKNTDIREDGRGTEGVAASDELEAVLNHLNQLTKRRNESEEQRAERYQLALSARAKHALNAYLTQSDLPQYEAKSALSQILGVDDYA